MKFYSALFLLLLSLQVHADCKIVGGPTTDYLHALLAKETPCPSDVRQFQSILEKKKLSVVASMVGNRGFHNPNLGSFSFFESVKGVVSPNLEIKQGEFFFGHFTDRQNGKIVLDQTPDNGKLMVELIVWDFKKQAFNFYEMIGNGNKGNWFYRGDSYDIFSDVKFLHLTPPAGAAKFGNRLRCSGCHTSGGPIMKEIDAPHNDWWSQKRHLPFGVNVPDSEVAGKMKNLEDSAEFAVSIKVGIQKLETSRSFQNVKNGLALPEQLRPLFCEAEINIVSDKNPLGSNSETVQIPSAFFVNPLLSEKETFISKSDYLELLQQFKMQFPETTKQDADHAWLTPVKGHSDILAIQTLIQSQVVDLKMALAILSIDKENPLVSKTRCGLLKFVPEVKSPTWVEEFKDNLKQSELSSTKTLLDLLENETEGSLSKQATRLLEGISEEIKTTSGLTKYFQKLIQTRNSVFQSEISKNPRGQILEPGFRVIFPKPMVGM